MPGRIVSPMDPPATILGLPHRFRTEVLEREEVEAVRSAALAILERVGIATSSERLLQLTAEHGQRVDRERRRIHLSPDFVLERLADAPERLRLTGRRADRDLELDGSRGYLSPDGCAPQLLDPATGRRRASTKADLGELTRLADALPEIGLLWRSVSANDVPAEVRSLHEVEVQLRATTKHVQTGAGTDGWSARGIVELLRAVAGGAEALRARPLLSSIQCVISPLFWDRGPVDAMAVYAEAGVPISVVSMAMACASAPATIAGLLALTVAEICSGVAIVQTLAPGAPVIATGYPATMDLRSGALNLAAGPDDAFVEMACVQVLRSLGLPCATGLFSSGAKRSDWQAGAQDGLAAARAVFSPADLYNGAGGLYAANVFSPVQLLLDAELFGVAVRWASGQPTDAEHLALEVIERVGPEGHFLAEPHTLRHMGELWRTHFLDTSSWEEWEGAGEQDAPARALAEVRRILAEHEPEPLEEDLARELAGIVAAYEAEALGGSRSGPPGA